MGRGAPPELAAEAWATHVARMGNRTELGRLGMYYESCLMIFFFHVTPSRQAAMMTLMIFLPFFPASSGCILMPDHGLYRSEL